jgi:transposase
LRLVDDPDERIPIPAPVVCGCGWSLAGEPVSGVRRRQVHDLAPVPAPVVTEYAAQPKTCPGCGATAAGRFPEGVTAPARYGPEVTAKAADVVLGHHVPVYRSTLLLMELCGIGVSAGWMASLRPKAAALPGGGFVR